MGGGAEPSEAGVPVALSTAQGSPEQKVIRKCSDKSILVWEAAPYFPNLVTHKLPIVGDVTDRLARWGRWHPTRALLTPGSAGTLSCEPDGDEGQDSDVICS